MNKRKQKKIIAKNINANFDMSDRLNYIKSSMEFGEHTVKTRCFNWKLATAFTMAAVVIGVGSGVGTYYAIDSSYTDNSDFIGEKYIEEAQKYIKRTCATFDESPFSILETKENYSLYLYRGYKDMERNEIIYFYQLNSEIMIFSDVSISFINSSNDSFTVFINDDSFHIGQINSDTFPVKDTLSISVYCSEELILYTNLEI